MKRRVTIDLFALFTLLGVLILAIFAPSAALAQDQPDSRYFPQTGKTVHSIFLDYWQRNGGLPRQGYPISTEIMERSDTDGKLYAVQYFERAVFEYHPSARPANRVQLSLLGVFLYSRSYPAGAPNQQPNTTPASRLFPQTGKRLGGPFLQYWQRNGGLAQLGYPISDEFRERSPLDGKFYTVQYFERAVMELHPELSTSSRVLLSHLGTFRLRLKYPTAPPEHSPFSADEINYFIEVALGTEFGDSQPVVARWARPVRIKVNGSPTPADRQTLLSVIEEINTLLGEEKLTLVERDPNLNLYFVPRARFTELDPDYVPGNEGFASVFWDGDHRIYRAIVLITTERVTQRERSHLIREELTQSLGLLKDSFKYPDSIFYQPWTDTQTYAPIDRALIRILHLPQLRPGMTEIEVRAVLNSIDLREP
jgi:hypothetical protein